MSNSLEHNFMDNQHAVKGLEVFVGGLSRTITEDKIHEVFSSCGQIMEVRLIKDQKGNLKGFCFVRFATKEAAERAVKEKSGVMIDGKKIGVLPSADQDTLFLGNLYKGWSADDFDRIVRQVFPDVVSVDLAMPFSSGENPASQKEHNRGFSFVKFSSHAAAARAYRAASKPEFLLGGSLHPAVQWAEEEPEIDPKELAKIKIAFVRNLPTSADENYLMKLFVPFGKVDKVVLSKKSRSPVGFVHFDSRSDLDNAIQHMNGKTVQGPNGGPPFELQVEVARPLEKSKKRGREDVQSKQQPSKVPSYPKPVQDDPDFTSFGGYKPLVQKDPVLADPYEAAVVSLPVAVKERLLRILRLGIATRFDMDIHCLTSLKELPESTVISVLDQFMLSGADKHNKGAYLAGLISRYQGDKLGVTRMPMSLSRVGNISMREPELPSFSSRVHLPPVDSLSSHLGTTGVRSDSLASRYSSFYSDYPLPSRTNYGRMEETSPARLQHHQIPPPQRSPAAAAASSTPYGRIGVDSHHSSSAADRQPSRPQVRFDPYTGEPYKFDPFTGEPILPEGLPHRFGSPY